MDATPESRPASRIGDTRLAARLAREIEGEVLFDAWSRGRYSTDASIYQIEPIGVAVPKTEADIARIIAVCADEGVPVLPRGAGTSQCGQTVGEAVVVDVSKHLNEIIELDKESGAVTVQPGLVLDRLNAYLRPHGLFFPVDPSTASRATLGGMAANNSCGARSIRYGLMRHNVRAIDAVLADGSDARFGPVPDDADALAASPRYAGLVREMQALGAREAGEIAARFPKVLRRVGGYNIDALAPTNVDGGAGAPNMAHLLVGSEGTLAFFRRLELQAHPIPAHNVMGVCHFARFRDAMDITRHIVALEPSAVELIDSTMIGLARAIPAYRPLVERFVRGEPAALLMVEFAGEDAAAQRKRLADLDALLADHGFPGAMLDASDATLQRDVMEVRKAGLNIMMSMKGDGKPVSFIEDCAVGLDDLAEYTDRLTGVFRKHGVDGTWYAHASVGCLHVRPVLNMKDGGDVKKMRAIAEEAFAMVREYKGSHSGEHGDGIVRSEFHGPMFGDRIVAAFGEVKRSFDPDGLFNPGKIVRPPAMDDRTLFRYRPDYAPDPLTPALDWSEWGGFDRAVEMCNNNGACRQAGAGVMCPSFRVTGDEQHVTRGRANALRLALTGQLGADALASDDMADAMALCVSCKACRRECPTGVDMARMKIEVLRRRAERRGLRLRDRLIAYLPRYAPLAARAAPLANLASRLAPLAGFARKRPLPRWRADAWDAPPPGVAAGGAREVVLLADCFDRYFEPDNLRAAHAVLHAGGYHVRPARAGDGPRPLCCGRSFLSAGLVDRAREEAARTVAALRPYVEEGVAVVGLEPACLLTLRDEFTVLLPGAASRALADNAVLFEEFIAAEHAAGRLALRFAEAADGEARRALVHGHCHQKSFGAMAAVETALSLVPGLDVETIASGCCGMAGSFGFEAEHHDVSMAMGEANLLPAVRAAADDALIVADGTSCRQQIRDGAGRQALHAARVLHSALAD